MTQETRLNPGCCLFFPNIIYAPTHPLEERLILRDLYGRNWKQWIKECLLLGLFEVSALDAGILVSAGFDLPYFTRRDSLLPSGQRGLCD